VTDGSGPSGILYYFGIRPALRLAELRHGGRSGGGAGEQNVAGPSNCGSGYRQDFHGASIVNSSPGPRPAFLWLGDGSSDAISTSCRPEMYTGRSSDLAMSALRVIPQPGFG
jgi:hypothetical protein